MPRCATVCNFNVFQDKAEPTVCMDAPLLVASSYLVLSSTQALCKNSKTFFSCGGVVDRNSKKKYIVHTMYRIFKVCATKVEIFPKSLSFKIFSNPWSREMCMFLSVFSDNRRIGSCNNFSFFTQSCTLYYIYFAMGSFK